MRSLIPGGFPGFEGGGIKVCERESFVLIKLGGIVFYKTIFILFIHLWPT